MKTLIAIIENFSSNKSTFGAALSKATGIPVFDRNQYRAKYKTLPDGSGEQKAMNELMSDIGKQEIAILDHSWATDALKVSQKFDNKIVFLADSQEAILILGCVFTSTMEKTAIENTNYPVSVKSTAQLIQRMNSKLLIHECHDKVSIQIYTIKSVLKDLGHFSEKSKQSR